MKALVLFSGGIDSTTALGLAIKKYGKDQVIALSVSYGQKHDKEIKAAIAVAQYYGVEHLFLDLVRYFNIVTVHCFYSLQKTFRRRVTQNRFQKQMAINQ